MPKFDGFLKYKIQIFATLAACLTGVLHGAGLGWLSPAIIFFQSTESTLVDGPISNDQVSILGSIFPVGSIIGSILFGYIVNSYGRKKALFCLVVSQLIFWITLVFARNYETILFARIMSGINAGSSFNTIPIYITEISNKEIRGSLGSVFTLAISIGITVSYIIGAYLPYEMLPKIFIGFPIIYFICIYKLPETPQFLLLRGNEIESKNSFKFYQNAQNLENSTVFENMFKEFKENCLNSVDNTKITLSDFTNYTTLKIFGHCLILGCIFLLTGGFVIMNLAGSVFEQFGIDLDSNTSAIIIGACHVAGIYLSTLIANRMTRKNLLALSSGLSFLGLIITAVFIKLFEIYKDSLSNYSWIPVLSLSFTIFVMSFGIMAIAFHVIAELVPQKIKPQSYALVNVLLNFVSMANFQLFSTLMFYFGLASALFYCSAACILSLIYCLVFLPETSEKFV